ncbi:hypothetical protein ACFSNO_03330 [Streptomyces cirratus]
MATDGKDQGDSFEMSVWRTDGGLLDDAALLRVAEKVLPALPGWSPPADATAGRRMGHVSGAVPCSRS